jgi:hypothetical protein
MKMRGAIVLVTSLLSLPAQGLDLAGRVKVEGLGYHAGADTVEAALGYKTASESDGQLRLDFSHRVGGFRAAITWQLDARHGTAAERDRTLADNFPQLVLEGANEDYWDLDNPLASGRRTQSSQRIDRLNVSYTRGNLVLRVGRQALTWGSGLVFHPMDIVNPFQPVATDTAYKLGADMVYGQWLFDNGSDLQLASVLRRPRSTTSADAGEDTHALLANVAASNRQWTILLAENRSDAVYGLATNGAYKGAVWNIEAVATNTDENGTHTSALFNASYAGMLLERNVTWFAELYHNGFGETARDYTAADLDPALLSRLRRGESFVTGRDYLSLGLDWEWTPLVRLMPTVIVNLKDHSVLLDNQLSWSLTNNTFIKAGLRVAFGEGGSEFKGLELAPMTGIYLAQPDEAFIRLESYF